jgi:Ser/Thr protein kinase RdoA (MazF antagonist)
VDGEVFVSVWYWIAGAPRPLNEYAPEFTSKIGAFMAKMHTLTAKIQPPFTHPLDAVLANRPQLDYEGLFGEHSPYASEEENEFITGEHQAVLDAVAENVREVMVALDSDEHTTGLIHGDFIYKNTLVTPSGGLAAIDFDDCGFGYFLYDMACPLLFYRAQPAYEALKAGLWDGYTAVRPLPGHYRDMLDVLVAGRYVASCRWVAAHANHPAIRGKAPSMIAGRVAELRTFLETGRL